MQDSLDGWADHGELEQDWLRWTSFWHDCPTQLEACMFETVKSNISSVN